MQGNYIYFHLACQAFRCMKIPPDVSAFPLTVETYLLYADPDRMMQVFSNLISNALRYTPERGQITLSSQVQAGNIVLGVRDSGRGIPPEQLPLVFERFYRGDPSRHQEQNESGLGLAIAKSTVEAQGGSISVSSTMGEDAAFTISFPVKRL